MGMELYNYKTENNKIDFKIKLASFNANEINHDIKKFILLYKSPYKSLVETNNTAYSELFLKESFFTKPVNFSIGNSSDAFLILRAQDLGLAIKITILAYVLFNLTYALFSIPAGIIVDKIGAKKVLVAGLLIFAIVYFFLGFINKLIIQYGIRQMVLVGQV